MIKNKEEMNNGKKNMKITLRSQDKVHSQGIQKYNIPPTNDFPIKVSEVKFIIFIINF